MTGLKALLRRIFTTPYAPEPDFTGFLSRAQTQDGPSARVTVAVLDAEEGRRVFGVRLDHRGVQAVHLRIANRSLDPLRLQIVGINRSYYTPLEAAAVNHFSFAKRVTAFGLIGWIFLPLLALVPLKLITAWRANRRMDDCFRAGAFRLRPIAPGGESEGFVFTPLDVGTKEVHVRLLRSGGTLDAGAVRRQSGPPAAEEFVFSVPVPGITADHLRRDFGALFPVGSIEECDRPVMIERLVAMPAATTNKKGTGRGDPVNLVVAAELDVVLSAFAGRWDETETITLATCWKTVRAFLLGSEYRYSPVSPLFLFGRSQDVALQRSRHSINERLHLRLWLTPFRFEGSPVWVGQVSRDIGVRFTTRVWNLTTHRIDPDLDEARDYVLEDLLEAERVEAAGYLDGVGACDAAAPRRNLTGDPYFTDGKRVVVMVSPARTAPRFVALT